MRTPTGETPFMLAHGNNVMIPAKVELTNLMMAHYQDEENKKQLHLILDLIDEVRVAS